MAHFRYRLVEIPLMPARPQPEQIETGLNVLTDQGWRVVSLEVNSEFSGRGSRVRVLVEQVEEEELDPVA
jgi:hypothetical protein